MCEAMTGVIEQRPQLIVIPLSTTMRFGWIAGQKAFGSSRFPEQFDGKGKTMNIKQLVRTTAIATAVTATLGFAAVQPASAATRVYTSNGAYAELDNNPANGGASWIWWFGGGAGETWVQYKYYNDNTVHYTGKVGSGTSASINPGQDVWQIQVCNHYYHGQDNRTDCSQWS